MVGLQTLDLAIGVRVPASQPTKPSASHSVYRKIAKGTNLLTKSKNQP
jgi:hypothetical protein